MLNGFALFRQPHGRQLTLIGQTEGRVQELPSCSSLTGCSGFVVAPFAPSAVYPVLLIRPDRVEQIGDLDMSIDDLESKVQAQGLHIDDLESRVEPGLVASSCRGFADYHRDFALFHDRLLNGDFQKLVLSRCLDLRREPAASPLRLFLYACKVYPRMFVSLAYTPQSGLWLTATPEVLLASEAGGWHTVALAGTMTYREGLLSGTSPNIYWSRKDMEEQHCVASYITRRLQSFTDDIAEEGPHTVRAGHLAHLRSDFHFKLPAGAEVGSLIEALHPTPAVCGLPKQEALSFILRHEHHDRAYYSGFMGPLFPGGLTALYVTLRCMQIFSNGYRLYAGGGLLRDSVELQEWQETECKLDTMRKLVTFLSTTDEVTNSTSGTTKEEALPKHK